MELPACDSSLTFVTFARSTLALGFGPPDSTEGSVAAVDSLVDRTYGTLLRWDLRNRLSDNAGDVSKQLAISFGVASDGSVETLEIAPGVGKRVRAIVSEHVDDWRLPERAGEARQAERELRIPQR
jgi:hypothetical protein